MAKTPATRKARKAKTRPGSAPRPKRRAAAGATGCKYVAEWKFHRSTAGMTQVWVSTRQYKKVVAALLKLAKSPTTKGQLRARRLSVGVTHVCGGTCGGGWCKEVLVPETDSVATACECAYFV